MRVLVMGCGSIGIRHLEVLSWNKELELAAYDPFKPAENRVEDLAFEVTFFNNLEDAADWAANLVIVATPNNLHFENALWAFSNGSHVLCEKPMVVTVEEGETMVKKAREANKVLAVGLTERYRLGVSKIIEMATGGECGNLVGGRAMVGTYDTLMYAKDKNTRESQKGTLILDYVHELDMLAAIFGEVVKARCFTNNLAQKELKANPTLAAAVLEYRNGCIVSTHFDYVQLPARRQLEVYGDKKVLNYNFMSDTLEIFDCMESEPEIITFDNLRNEQFYREHNDMINAIKIGTQPKVSGEDGLKSIKAAQLLLDSINSKTPDK